jgi:hypothetical protein
MPTRGYLVAQVADTALTGRPAPQPLPERASSPESPLPGGHREETEQVEGDRQIQGWKTILNALTMNYGERIAKPAHHDMTPGYTRNRTVPVVCLHVAERHSANVGEVFVVAGPRPDSYRAYFDMALALVRSSPLPEGSTAAIKTN